MFNMAVSVLQQWNNPNYLHDVGAGTGWYRLWCRLCGKKGGTVKNEIKDMAPKGIRDPWICDKCKKRISNG